MLLWNSILFVCAILCAALGGAASYAQPSRMSCDKFVPNTAPGELLDWRDTVRLEHCDRMSRLQRISRYASGAPPQFFEVTLSEERLPPSFDVEVPLLRVVFPERVFFDTDEALLRPEAMEVVRVVSRSLRLEPPDVALFVAGHADARGSRAYNQNLSIDRANAVAAAIRAEGVNVASVWRVGFGEDMPLVAGDSMEAYGQNRRVEFLFAARPEAVAVWLADAQVDLLCQGRTRREMDDCRASLDLRQDYLAVEVSGSDANAALGRSSANTDLENDAVQAGLRNESANVTPGGAHVVADVDSARTIVNPVGTRRIRIDPVNRRFEPIDLGGG